MRTMSQLLIVGGGMNRGGMKFSSLKPNEPVEQLGVVKRLLDTGVLSTRY